MRGFASRVRRKEYFTHYFRLDSEPVEANLKNIAKARDFHGGPSEINLEGRMAEIEGHQAHLVRQLRRGERLDQIDAISSLFVSLHLRSDNVRKAMSTASKQFFAEINNALKLESSKESLLACIGEELEGRCEEGELDEYLRKVPSVDARSLFNEALKSVSDKVRVDIDLMVDAFPQLIEKLNLEATSRKTHLQMLRDNPAPVKRIERIIDFHWKLISDEREWVLGDVCGFADVGPTRDLVNTLAVEEQLDAVYLPLSAQVVLVGSREPAYLPRCREEINLASAELSTSFFIATVRSTELSALQSQIGKRARIMTNAEMSAVVPSFTRDSLRKLLAEERVSHRRSGQSDGGSSGNDL